MLDFLYADHERVASLVSQIEGVGALVGYGRHYEKDKTTGGKVKGATSIISGEKSGTASYNKQLRQEYDPLWINSQKLVEVVNSRSSEAARDLDYGSLVTVSGKLVCLDQSFMGSIFKSDAIIEQIAQGVEVDRSNRSSKSQKKQKIDIAKTIQDFLSTLPLGIVFILFSGQNAYWFNVKREYLSLQDLDIPLKFPVAIGGTWHVTGLVDAMPQDHANVLSEFQELGSKLVFPQAFSILVELAIPLVGMFGRPADSYGLSPVTIHREISF